MAHFAKIDSNNIVQQVVVINNDILVNFEGNEIEQLGIEFCKSLYGQDTNWVQTSYNGNIRFRFAGIGMIYDSVNNVFLHSKPFNSWILNETTWEWNAPIAYPSDNKTYAWNEENQTWDLFTPPQPFNSWTWNEAEWRWEAPSPQPDGAYVWNEDTQTWVAV